MATIDCHANVTQHMVDLTDAMVFYHTQPHVDHVETGALGARILTGILHGGPRPAKAFRSLPMVLPGENGNTTGGAFEPVMREVVAAEKRPGVLSAGACAVQPWMDLAEYGCTVIVYAAEQPLADREADRLAETFWDARHDFIPALTGIDDAIAQAAAPGDGTFVFGDSADAPGLGRHRRQHGAAAGPARRRLPAPGSPQHRRRRGGRCRGSRRDRRGGPAVDRRLARPDLLPAGADRRAGRGARPRPLPA